MKRSLSRKSRDVNSRQLVKGVKEDDVFRPASQIRGLMNEWSAADDEFVIIVVMTARLLLLSLATVVRSKTKERPGGFLN